MTQETQPSGTASSTIRGSSWRRSARRPTGTARRRRSSTRSSSRCGPASARWPRSMATGRSLVDADGDEVIGMAAIVEALGASRAGRRRRARRLPDQADGPRRGGQRLARRDAVDRAAGRAAPQPGGRHREAQGRGARRRRRSTSDDEVSFVATDLLWLDGTSLLDVPLLERRRLLESVLVESDVVRVGAFVRPPIESWVSSWRSMGFTGLTYKAANSRYLPGEPNPDWVDHRDASPLRVVRLGRCPKPP